MNLKKFEELLLQEKKRILEILQAEMDVNEQSQSAWVEPKDPEDLANLKYSNDLRGLIYTQEAQTLREIEEALERIKIGKYGICEKCKKEIEEERLEIIPWTRFCSSCSKKFEKPKF